ncbi:MAG TPA: hypothetical protein VJT77_02770 [Burkholderiales bacterium]|nr:hypothetical protein [Burkholderiales bacterium]
MKSISVFVVATFVALASAPAHAEMIVNGGFEAGFTGWTRVDAIGSDGTFFLQSGTSSPVNGFPVPPPPEGTTAAMTDAEAGGSHVLYQDFLVPASVGQTTLSFQAFIQNGAIDFFTPDHLEWSTSDLNQQARVDILLPGLDPFTVSASDVLLNVFQTKVGDAPVSGYDLISADITSVLNAHPNETLRLRFAEVDNVSFFNFGVDDVRFVTVQALPEPATFLLALAAFLTLAVAIPKSARRTFE